LAITVTVRHGDGGDTRLTFDGTQRVVIGRGAGSDVRLPDASVSHRHASLRAQGADFVILDEGSTNGTFVGSVRIASRTSRVVRSGDKVRVGRIWIEVRLDQSPVTRDVAAATKDLAFALVSQAMAVIGTDRTPRVTVVEGRDQGASLPLTEEGRVYVIGRAPSCDLPLDDADCSREHLDVALRAGVAHLRDRGAKNGTLLGDAFAPPDREVPWRPTMMVRVGRTVLALDEPVARALAEIEDAPDEPTDDAPPPPAAPAPPAPTAPAAESAAEERSVAEISALEASEELERSNKKRRASGWSVTDLLVMAAAVTVLALSLAGLVWLLRG
jgi:pSer/pThr/pTyr-binding forkhead associated (FHA) protein